MKDKLKDCTEFDWDVSNINKNWYKHHVNFTECEEIFFNKPFWVYFDKKHSEKEERYYSLGRTNNERMLFVVFTVREKKIRIISARDMNKNERKIYIEKSQKDS